MNTPVLREVQGSKSQEMYEAYDWKEAWAQFRRCARDHDRQLRGQLLGGAQNSGGRRTGGHPRLEPESALRVPAGLKSGSEQGARSHLFGIPVRGGESAKSV